MNGEITWEKASQYLFPEGAPELEPWRKAIIIAHLERCLAEFGSEFCETKRGLMISQLTRKGLVTPLEH